MITAVKIEIVLLTFAENMNIIDNRDEFFGDGTFRYSPAFYYQVYTIHTECLGHYVPLFYCLFPTKYREVYRNMLQIITEECKKQDVEFSPSSTYLDFELATHQIF